MKKQIRKSSLYGGASIVVLAVLLAAGGASAAGLPTHGHFVSGQGTIAKANQSLTVKQSSTTGIINWNSFSVGAKHGVTFDNGSGATLNRVTGGNLSRIAGSLHATGSLYLMNTNGVIVSGTGHIVTGGSFAASTGSLSNSAFNDSERRFKAGTGNIVNRGSITAGGSVTLASRDVRDTGTIRASAVNLQATRSLSIDGSIAAQRADGSGGTVIATGRNIAVGSKANISARGTRGGTVLIGGDVHGGAIAADNFVKRNVKTAQNTVIAAGAHISADGSRTTGGDIVVWSNGRTSFEGQISARGQTKGGFSEVSSHDLLGFAGTVNLTAAHGATGTLLLDPENVTISTAANSTDTCTGGTCTPTGDNSNINVTTLENALATADVTVTTGSSGSQAGDIAVLSPITWSANTLTLDAYHSIDIEAAMSATGTAGLTLTTSDGGSGGDYSFGLGPNGFAGSITFANTSEALTINGTAYTLLESMSDVQNINNNLTGNYALANSLDASSVNNWIPIGTDSSANVLNSGNGFAGTFTGLGNTISNLSTTIRIDNGQTNYAGLFGYSSGTIRDVGVVGGTISAGEYDEINGQAGGVAGLSAGTISDSYSTATIKSDLGSIGGLVGENAGTIENSFAGGTVTVESGNAGGLVGYNYSGGTIRNSYATGSVGGSSDIDGGSSAGGLVGLNWGTGTISDSYATGAVTGGNDGNGGVGDGGLVGYNTGIIENSYATGQVASLDVAGGLVGEMDDGGSVTDSYSMGAVSGGNSSGGLIGYLYDGTVSHSYWDTRTSGLTNGIGKDENHQSGNVTGLTTTQLEGNLPADFSSATWGTGTGLLPYLLWQFPSGTPEAISGQVLKDGAAVVGDQVLALIDGNAAAPAMSVGSTATGFFYLLFAPGSLSGNHQVLAYVPGTSGGAALLENVSGTDTAAQIMTGYLYAPTPDSLYSEVAPNLATAIGGNTSVQNLVDGLGLYLAPTAAHFTIDQAIDTSDLVISSSGTVTQSAAITAGNLDLLGMGRFTLTNASNSISTLAADAGVIDLTDSGDLAMGTVDGTSGVTTSGVLTLNAGGTLKVSGTAGTTANLSSGGAMTVNVTAKTVRLASGSTIAGGITAKNLSGSSNGKVKLGGNISDLAGFDTNGNGFVLDDSANLVTTGTIEADGASLAITTGSGALTVDSELIAKNETLGGKGIAIDDTLDATAVALNSTAGISESAAGAIDATTLTGSSASSTKLSSAHNQFADLGAFTGGGNLSFTDDHKLTTTGTVNSGTARLNLTTVGADNNIAIDSAIGDGVVTLITTGKATESNKGAIDASTLNVTAKTGIVLTSPKNKIFVVGTDKTNSGPNKITL